MSEGIKIQALLQKYWGPDFSLRPVQASIIQALIRRQDALILLPTGAGKSLCFQLTGLYLGGITLIISPLIALMEDQVQALKRRQLKAAYLHSQLSKRQRTQTLAELKSQGGFLYLAPEQLQSRDIQNLFQTQPPSLLVLDEAHCLSLWGHDFRPEYQRILSFLPSPRPPIAAFTATAPPSVLADLENCLKLQTPIRFDALPLRDNLALKIQGFWIPRQRWNSLKQAIQSQKKSLIYAATRQNTENLVKTLQSQISFPVLGYHAGLSPETRRQAYLTYLNTPQTVMVATKAFGMGIDIPDISQVIHWQIPDALENYVQEVGRAGRSESLKAQAILMYLRGERAPIHSFLRQYLLSQEQIQKVLRGLAKGWDNYRLQDKYNVSPIQLNIIQGVMYDLGLLQPNAPLEQTFSPQAADSKTVKIIRQRLAELKKRQEEKFKAVQAFIKDKKCRLQSIDRYFGQKPRPACGCCDNCQ